MKVRTLFLSDIHLGCKHAQPQKVLDILRYIEAEKIYLIGDIIDFWRMRRRARWWSQECNDVMQKLLRAGRKGVEIVYIPGNHDEILRNYIGYVFGRIRIQQDSVHRTTDGLSYLVMHGDEVDVVIRTKITKWLAHFGDHSYNLALELNHPINWIRHKFGLRYWSLSAYLKRTVKEAVSFIGMFEESVINHANEKGVDGIICGHIHTPSNRRISVHDSSIHYLNCGDFVESCSAVVEHPDGSFELVYWSENMEKK